MTLSAVIIDDEPQSRGILEEHLLEFEEIKLSGMASCVTQALQLISVTKPDILLLDVSMPGQNGFSLLEQLPNKDFMVVFVTAHQKYAINAFDARAIHYLLKPIDQDKFEEAINRCIEEAKRGSITSYNTIDTTTENLETKLSVAVGDHHLLLSSKNIIRVEGAGSYSTIFTEGGKRYTISKNMKAMDKLLTNYNFFRIHKSHLVNLNFIEEYSTARQSFLKLADETKIDISFRKRKEFASRLKTIL